MGATNQPMIDFDTLFKKMYASELSTREEIMGCSEAEISAIESKLRLTLPASYKDFLSRMGKCAGWYQFLFFETASGNDDPPVYRFIEGDKASVQVADSFSNWLSTMVIQESKLNEKVKGRRPR